MGVDCDQPLPVVRVGEIPSEDNAPRWLVEQLWGASSVGVIGGAPKVKIRRTRPDRKAGRPTAGLVPYRITATAGSAGPWDGTGWGQQPAAIPVAFHQRPRLEQPASGPKPHTLRTSKARDCRHPRIPYHGYPVDSTYHNQ